jgi:hypothetical protein
MTRVYITDERACDAMRSFSPTILVVTAAIALLGWTSPPIATSAAAPSTQRAAQREADVARWFAQLADADPAVRDAARQKLMDIPRSDLATLQRVVADQRPLAPAQAVALHEIVLHIHLSSAPYQYNQDGGGFMGVQLVGGRDYEPIHVEGAVVQQRFPGLVAFQMLRDGDIIVGAEESSAPITSADTLRNTIDLFHPGQTVHLKVQRAGRLMIIPITLDFRPADQRTFQEMRNRQLETAERLWTEHFQPLLEPVTS